MSKKIKKFNLHQINSLGIKIYANGFWQAGLGNTDKPDYLQILCSKIWIRETLEKRKYINREYSSYGLKHQVERDMRKYTTYISNGALIQAMLEEGFEAIIIGPNGYFNYKTFERKDRIIEQVKCIDLMQELKTYLPFV
jgi:hypothetical protein